MTTMKNNTLKNGTHQGENIESGADNLQQVVESNERISIIHDAEESSGKGGKERGGAPRG